MKIFRENQHATLQVLNGFFSRLLRIRASSQFAETKGYDRCLLSDVIVNFSREMQTFVLLCLNQATAEVSGGHFCFFAACDVDHPRNKVLQRTIRVTNQGGSVFGPYHAPVLANKAKFHLIKLLSIIDCRL